MKHLTTITEDRHCELASSDSRDKRRRIGGGGSGGGVRSSFADRLKAAMERGNTPGERVDVQESERELFP